MEGECVCVWVGGGGMCIIKDYNEIAYRWQ